MTQLDSQRLTLRPVASADLAEVHALWTDPDVRRFLFDDRVLSEEEVRELIETSEQNFRDHGLGVWLVAEKPGQRLVGFAGFLMHEEAPSLLYGVRSEDAGRGIATEAAAAAIAYATGNRRHRRVVADVDEPNVASVRVLEKIGMTRTRREVVNGAPLLYFEFVAAPDDA